MLVVDKPTYAGDLESLTPVARHFGYSFVRADTLPRRKDIFRFHHISTDEEFRVVRQLFRRNNFVLPKLAVRRVESVV